MVLRGSARLDAWLEAQQFRGWDPHDALNSPVLRALTFGNRYLGIAWLQLVKRSPLNLRPVLGVPKGHNPKGMGLFLASYLRKGDVERSRFFARWLVDNASRGFRGPCWGYNFDWPNRGFFAAKGTPTIVNTSFNGFAFLDAARMMPGVAPGVDPLAVARGACEFMLRDLNVLRERDEICFSYTPLDRRLIHNANALGAQLLAEVGALTGEAELADAARAAARFTARRQNGDGSWPYGIGSNYAWVDNFHTAYVLVALRRTARALSTTEFDGVVRRGYQYWTTRMFDSRGVPMYYAGNLYPIDIHAIAAAILAWREFRDEDLHAEQRAWTLAAWAVEQMQDERGFFHYQIARRYRIRIPYIRWSQAWMQRALIELLYQSRPLEPR